MTTGRIILHIGRNKAGSTTLQALCLRHRAALADRGVLYCLFGHLADSVPGVPGFAFVPQLADYVRANPGRAILVSNEFLFGWPDDFTRDLVRDLAGLDISVLAYIRPYFDWLRSAYAEAVGTGETTLDFDAYTDVMRPRVSAYPYLHSYASRLGWARLRIRSLDPACLHGADLFRDFQHAIGIADDLAGTDRPENPSEHWAVLELLRMLIRPGDQAGWPACLYLAAMDLRARLRALVAGHGGSLPVAAYGNASLRDELDALYDADLTQIASETGLVLPPARAGGPMPLQPSLDLLPGTLLSQARVIARQTVPAGFLTG